MTKLSSITVILFSIALLGVGCARPGDVTTQSDPAEVVQEEAGGLVQVGKEGAVTLYEGEVVISGEYYFNEFGSDVCFRVDQESRELIPSKDQEFCFDFDNVEDAAQAFYDMSRDALVQAAIPYGSDPRVNPYMIPKPATIRISGYKVYAGKGEDIYAVDGLIVDLPAGAGLDRSTLIDVIAK